VRGRERAVLTPERIPYIERFAGECRHLPTLLRLFLLVTVTVLVAAVKLPFRAFEAGPSTRQPFHLGVSTFCVIRWMCMPRVTSSLGHNSQQTGHRPAYSPNRLRLS
jgi:hypothetical protein